MIGFLANLIAGNAIGRIRASVRPNVYAPRLPDQAVHAAAQSGYGLKPGTSGLAGSEHSFYDDPQDVSSIGWNPLTQDITSKALPPSTFEAGDPGADPSDATVLADFYDGPVGSVLTWGMNQRAAAPHVIRGRINEPTRTIPLPRALVTGRLSSQPAAVADPFDTAFDS